MIFFSAHGVPLAYVEEAGDPYKAEMEECVDLIMEELEKRKITNGYTLAYQVLLCFLMSFLVFYSHDPSLCFLNISDEDELCPILCLWIIVDSKTPPSIKKFFLFFFLINEKRYH
jgi:hypothetical protein